MQEAQEVPPPSTPSIRPPLFLIFSACSKTHYHLLFSSIIIIMTTTWTCTIIITITCHNSHDHWPPAWTILLITIHVTGTPCRHPPFPRHTYMHTCAATLPLHLSKTQMMRAIIQVVKSSIFPPPSHNSKFACSLSLASVCFHCTIIISAYYKEDDDD